MKTKTIIILSVVVMAGLLSATGLVVWNRYFRTYYGYKPLEFSKEAWATADAEHRGYMLNDLLKKHRLKGMAYDDVIDLLGKPDREHVDRTTGRVSSIRYGVGYRGMNPRAPLVFSSIFIINFDEQAKVEMFVVDS